jgi:hypothetical protein
MPGPQQAAVGNFAIISSGFFGEEFAKSLMPVHSASKVGKLPNNFWTWCRNLHKDCARKKLKTGKIFTPPIAKALELRNNFPSLIFWLEFLFCAGRSVFTTGGTKLPNNFCKKSPQDT